MSEPNSLYVRVRLSKPAFEHYLASISADARQFSDWMDWLGKARMYGPGLTSVDIVLIGQRARKRTVADVIAAWTMGAPAFAGSNYNERTETWQFAAPFFSKNYLEYLELLPPFRAVDRFKDRPGVDFMLVYDHFFNPGHYSVLFEFSEGSSIIAGSPGQGVPFPQHHADEADAFIRSLAPADTKD